MSPHLGGQRDSGDRLEEGLDGIRVGVVEGSIARLLIAKNNLGYH